MKDGKPIDINAYRDQLGDKHLLQTWNADTQSWDETTLNMQ
jgi:hypothetical protein